MNTNNLKFFLAALKCRQRKKQWLQNLQTKVEYLAADNEQYRMQANALREELINLKTLLMAHKDCPINQQDMKTALNRPIPGAPSLPHLLSNNSDDV
jgi:ribosomal protein L28